MSGVTPQTMVPGLAAGNTESASQHTRPDKKATRVRTGRLEIRLTFAERRELEQRAAGQDVSTWLRALALGQPAPVKRTARRRRNGVRPTGSLAAQQQARALMSLAQSLGGLVDRMRPGAPRDQVAKLIEYVRRKWEGLPPC